ncbi:MAG: PdaC/SigV domain-containing protein [Oceanihabitans sp.]
MVFSEINILNETASVIEINIPKAVGNSNTAKAINNSLVGFVNTALHIDTAENNKETIAESIVAFNKAYANFNAFISEELREELPTWEALIDGEVVYNSPEIISIAINSSINTGAANSKMLLKFYNFNPQTGDLLTTKNVVKNLSEFTALAKKYYTKEVGSTFINANSFLSTNTFKLPENLGFNEEGVILLFTNFNATGFENEMLEFVIPYEVANAYLNF